MRADARSEAVPARWLSGSGPGPVPAALPGLGSPAGWGAGWGARAGAGSGAGSGDAPGSLDVAPGPGTPAGHALAYVQRLVRPAPTVSRSVDGTGRGGSWPESVRDPEPGDAPGPSWEPGRAPSTVTGGSAQPSRPTPAAYAVQRWTTPAARTAPAGEDPVSAPVATRPAEPVAPSAAVVQRDAEPEPAATEAVGQRAPSSAPSVATSVASGGAAPNLDELVRRLYEPLAARLRAELWLDRERSGRSLTR